MEHYYSNNPTSKSEEHEIEYFINEKKLKFMVDNGVFSKSHIDIATNFMLKVLLNENIKGKILDVGCGYGAIGITLSYFFKDIDITMLDINERALNLARKNVMLNGLSNVKILESDGFSAIDDNEKFDIIVTNPPIRAGKKVIYKMYEDSLNHLKQGGYFYLVINKKHGAPSTISYLNELFSEVEVLDKKMGFNVIKCTKS